MAESTTITVPVEAPSAEAPKPQAEQLILGKFKTQEDLIKSYTELEKKVGAPAPQQQAAPVAEKKTEGNPLAIPAKVEAPAELDLTPFESEYDTTGALSEESYKKLATEYRVPKALVDSFIQSRLQQREAFTTSVFAEVGGKEAYQAMTGWAQQNLSADEVKAFDSVVTGRDPNAIKLAVAGLAARFTAANGKEPRLLGGGSTSSGPAPFRSVAEVQQAMQDPRYKTDPAYQKDVENRMSVSKVFG